jgi:hypothetical protein
MKIEELFEGAGPNLISSPVYSISIWCCITGCSKNSPRP